MGGGGGSMGAPGPPPSYAPVVVMQWWQKKNVQESVMQVQSCCFAYSFQPIERFRVTAAILVFQNKETAAMFSDVGVPNQSGRSWTLFLRKKILLFP